jgi:hypothetical protein
MNFLNASKLFSKLLGVIILLQIIGQAQKQERMIDKTSWRTEPIKILKIKTKGRLIELGKNFEEDDDWLKGLTVTVQNISDKVIARIELKLAFPLSGGGTDKRPTYGLSMIYGLDPADTGAEMLELVQPGESVDMKLPDVNLPFIKTDLKNLGYPEKIAHARIRVEYVTFVDGSMWAGDGDILYPDSTNPKRKVNPKLQIPKPRANFRPIPQRALFLVIPALWVQDMKSYERSAPSSAKANGFLSPSSLVQTPPPCDTAYRSRPRQLQCQWQQRL